MKGNIHLVLSLIIGFILGFTLKSILTDDKVSNMSVVVDKEQQQQVNETTPVNNVKPIQPSVNSRLAHDDEQLVLLDDDVALDITVNESHLSNAYKPNYLAKNSDEQLALLDWSSKHRNNLAQVIDESLPTNVANVMKLVVFKDNMMLDQALAQQEQDVDEAWAYITEQQVRDHIFQHELAHGIDLLSVTCKQLMCDILGVEREAHAWFEIYKSLYALPNIRYPDNEYQPTNVQRVENGIAYVYAQLMFNAANKGS